MGSVALLVGENVIASKYSGSTGGYLVRRCRNHAQRAFVSESTPRPSKPSTERHTGCKPYLSKRTHRRKICYLGKYAWGPPPDFLSKYSEACICTNRERESG